MIHLSGNLSNALLNCPIVPCFRCMLVHGIQGSQLGAGSNDDMTKEELEIFGVDWEGLHEDNILQSL